MELPVSFWTFVLIELLGVALIALALYLPNAQGFFWLGAITMLFGAVLAWVRRD